MKKIIIIILLLSGSICNSIQAQDVKFGKITKADFIESDTTSVASILYRSQKTYYDYRVDDGFIQITEYFKRIKFNKKEGLDYANVIQKIYDESATRKEIIEGVKGVTYNLVNGKIEKTKLKSKEIYQEKFNKYFKKIKMVMPNVKVGSVIDIKYVVESPFSRNINDVVIQELIPVKQFEYEVKIPEYLIFDIHENIKSSYKVKLTEESRLVNKLIKWKELINGESKSREYERNLNYHDRVVSFNEKNIPAFKEEAYAPVLYNYAAKLVFDLKETKSFDGLLNSYANTWDIITEKIYKSSSFGEELNKENYFKKDVDALLKSVISENEKITKVFNFVKSKVKWNDFVGKSTDLGVKKAYKNGVGNVADINLMLVSILRYAGINANPILTSTRSNGIPLFPTQQGFNYVICGVEINGDVLLLDATDKYTKVGVLPLRTLNWQGRLIRKSGSSTWVSLHPTKNSSSITMLSATLDEGLVFKGKSRSQKSNYFAYNYRVAYTGFANEDRIKNLSEDKGEIEITDLKITNENQLNKPIIQTYDFEYEDNIEEIGGEIYISPLLFLTETKNVFNKETRLYPVDFKFPILSKNIISIKIPDNYKIKSVPSSIKLEMSDNLGSYGFLVKQNGNMIQVSEEFIINYQIVPVNYYSELRKMYGEMIAKNAEKIILEKI